MNGRDSLEARVTELETKYTLLQKDFDALNETVLMNVASLDRINSLLSELNEKIESAKDNTPPRSLEDEKPPHY
ncbi:MAG: SlyX family protein [Planctomycetota bacterium]